jgi:pleiotropic regulator 1
MSFWDWKTGHRFQSLDTTAQPGSLDAEAGIMSSTFDRSGLRLICGEADKTSKSNITCPFSDEPDPANNLVVKIWKQDENASPETHPIQWNPTLRSRKF